MCVLNTREWKGWSTQLLTGHYLFQFFELFSLCSFFYLTFCSPVFKHSKCLKNEFWPCGKHLWKGHHFYRARLCDSPSCLSPTVDTSLTLCLLLTTYSFLMLTSVLKFLNLNKQRNSWPIFKFWVHLPWLLALVLVSSFCSTAHDNLGAEVVQRGKHAWDAHMKWSTTCQKKVLLNSPSGVDISQPFSLQGLLGG